eukprot:gb/GEZN01023211.1/.p1 GENE.gb/GEZN01023211.1/~~gb/GEZN01023211.1/.p1  ORF type:complete len:169 (-),score=22.95 gb/GEZN01023211.1/:93-533(-)
MALGFPLIGGNPVTQTKILSRDIVFRIFDDLAKQHFPESKDVVEQKHFSTILRLISPATKNRRAGVITGPELVEQIYKARPRSVCVSASFQQLEPLEQYAQEVVLSSASFQQREPLQQFAQEVMLSVPSPLEREYLEDIAFVPSRS